MEDLPIWWKACIDRCCPEIAAACHFAPLRLETWDWVEAHSVGQPKESHRRIPHPERPLSRLHLSEKYYVCNWKHLYEGGLRKLSLVAFHESTAAETWSFVAEYKLQDRRDGSSVEWHKLDSPWSCSLQRHGIYLARWSSTNSATYWVRQIIFT